VSKKYHSLKSITLTGVIGSAASVGALLPSTVRAASITSINLSAETRPGISNNVVNGVTYEGYARSIDSFVSGGESWQTVGAVSTTLNFQRSNQAPTAVDNNKQVVWQRCDTTANCAAPTLRGTVPTTTQAALTQNNIYLGTDNLFANRGNNDNKPNEANQSDVERVDFVFSTPYNATSDFGVTVFERGASTNVHDGFAIAAITGFDANNNPTYSSLKGYELGKWGTTDLLSGSDYTTYRILNNGTGQFALTGSNTQNIGGELIPLTDLVAANTPVLGYSLFGFDTFSAVSNNTCTIAQLSSISNTGCYAYNTREADGGGLDLLAANLGVSTRLSAQAVPEPLSIIGTILGGMAAFRMRKKYVE
jgi:hypothetical protein